ncbi:MAG: metallophosphoesterase family protein [Lachnospiraceae bacterium]|nr:metallophosphoesterase family protein [Lachnospiraceae bacterium]
MKKAYFIKPLAFIIALVMIIGCMNMGGRTQTANAADKTLTVGDVTGTLRSEKTPIKAKWLYTESGCLIGQKPSGGKMKFVSEGDDSVRVRMILNSGKGIPVKEGDYLILKYTYSEGIALSTIQIQGLIDDPEGWDSIDLGYFGKTDKNGYLAIELPEDYWGQTLFALRFKADDCPAGETMTFSYGGVLTDTSVKKYFSYKADPSVGGVSQTYYSDVFSRGFAWRTKDVNPKGQMVQYVDTAKVADIATYDWDANYKKDGSGDVKSVDDYFNVKLVNSDDSATYYCHKAHLENLPEGTSCYYRVGSSEGWSPVGQFKVNTKEEKFSFIHVTDPQATEVSEYMQFAALVDEAHERVAKDKDTYLVGMTNTGDITDECHDGNYFIEQYNMAQDFSKNMLSTVIIPVAGNHDTTEDCFFSMFDIDFANYCPDGKHNSHRAGGCYSYILGNVYMIGTNSNESGSLDGGSGEYDSRADYREQYAWIKGQLENAAKLREEGKINWIVMLSHAGMITQGYHSMDGGSVQLRKNLAPLYAEYKVDLVLQGHDHSYNRSVPYYYGKDVNGDTFDGLTSNNRETNDGNGTIVYDNPYTAAVETKDTKVARLFNIEPEGTHYVTINYGGTKSIALSQDFVESNYTMPDKEILVGAANSPVNNIHCAIQYQQQFYAVVTVQGDTLTYDTYEFNGNSSKLFDTFTVVKDGKHKPDITKHEIDFKGVAIESKTADGKAPKLDIADIQSTKVKSKKAVTEFVDYDLLAYSVTGTTASGKAYESDKAMPTEAGEYVLHVTVMDECSFFKGTTEFPFTIGAPVKAPVFDPKPFIGGLTK